MVIRILSIILYAFFTLECLSSNYPFRTWTSKTGVKIEARFIESSGDQLTIERSDSKKFVFPLALLSNEDQIYVRGTLKSLSQALSNLKHLYHHLIPFLFGALLLYQIGGGKMQKTIGLKGRID